MTDMIDADQPNVVTALEWDDTTTTIELWSTVRAYGLDLTLLDPR